VRQGGEQRRMVLPRRGCGHRGALFRWLWTSNYPNRAFW
jgi:hypothetical protein